MLATQRKEVARLANRSHDLSLERTAHAHRVRTAGSDILSSPEGLSWAFAAGTLVAAGRGGGSAGTSRLTRLMNGALLLNRFLKIPIGPISADVPAE